MQNNTAVAITRVPARQIEDRSSYLRSRGVWTAALCFSGVLGVGAGVVGLIFSFESLSGIASSELSQVGTILIAGMFPLLMLVAHCLDKIGETNKAIRLEYCRQNGLKEEDR